MDITINVKIVMTTKMNMREKQFMRKRTRRDTSFEEYNEDESEEEIK